MSSPWSLGPSVAPRSSQGLHSHLGWVLARYKIKKTAFQELPGNSGFPRLPRGLIHRELPPWVSLGLPRSSPGLHSHLGRVLARYKIKKTAFQELPGNSELPGDAQGHPGTLWGRPGTLWGRLRSLGRLGCLGLPGARLIHRECALVPGTSVAPRSSKGSIII